METRPEARKLGEPPTAAHLVERHFMDVYAVCWRVLGHPEDAEDATQETFLSLFRSLGTLGKVGSVQAWVLTIARNTAISLGRTRRRARPLLELPGGPASPPPLDLAADRDRLHDALAQLTEEDRELIQQRFLEGKTGQEVARESGKSPGAIATALCRAIERLRAFYHGKAGP